MGWVCIQAIVRFWRTTDPATKFMRQLSTWSSQHCKDNFTPVEWMAKDALDASKAFKSASVWIRSDPGGQLSLRKDCYKWGFFQELADLSRPGHAFRPRPDFDFWHYFKDVMQLQYGKVVEVSHGMWIWQEGPPNNNKDTWHCQYAKNRAQQDLMGQLGCRGSGGHHGKDRCTLTDTQIRDIGDTNVCQLDGEPPWQRHRMRKAYVVNYPRLMCWLLEEGDVSHFTAQSWWARAPTICQTKERGAMYADQYSGRASEYKGEGRPRVATMATSSHNHGASMMPPWRVRHGKLKATRRPKEKAHHWHERQGPYKGREGQHQV